jgi:SPX domain protein involved in polyphosphate accumulation
MVRAVSSNQEDDRYERKFAVSELSNYEIEAILKLHPALFSQIYHRRYVNNIYLDSPDLQCYYDTAEGISNRLKIRVRWYGDLFGLINDPVLELKFKDGLVGRKEQYSLPSFHLDTCFQRDSIVCAIKGSNMPEALKQNLAIMDIALLNRYARKYFQSADGIYRITIDSELEFIKVGTHSNNFLNRWNESSITIVELKYALGYDGQANQITSFFPFRMTKSSKYANGLAILNL